ncbi:hypothetical protein NCS52_01549000 [Fusarium sp. LHS14.1]|nr:hypothetical protein NCS52_01549000 [Fusarium sp. LHS14.1]
MTSQSVPIEISAEALNAYDDSSFINEDNSLQEHEGDSTRRPAFLPTEDRGFDFQPFEVPRRELIIKQLPQNPLSLFQHFIPISLVNSWVKYTNDWVNRLLQSGVIDSQEHEITEKSRLRAWKPTTAAELYIWLGILIYIGVHGEISVEDHWKTPQLEDQRPEHSIIKFMTYDRFQLLHRHLRLFDHTKFTDDDDFPIVFQCVERWSQHIQLATTELCDPGSHLAVDEGMIRYTGRNKQVTYVPNKPIDTGLKVWIAAQLGLFMRWIWHQPGAKYGPVGVERKKPASQRGRRKGKGRGSQRRAPNEVDEVKEVIHVITEAGDKIMALNSTQSVVIALINLLPQSTYHVFVDNLFSSPDLFRSLRQHGHGATGTARPNCGIYKGLADAKKADKAGKSGFQFNEIKVIPTADNQVNQIAWKDNALVLLLSTAFTGEERCDRWRKRPSTKTPMARPIQRFFSGEPIKLISIPTIAASYNDEMNHVDRGDQRKSYLGYDHPIRRGAWQAIAWTFLLDIVLVNSFLLQLHGEPAWERLPSTEPVKADFSSRRRIYARGTA